jgi:oxalate decarboxylase/phosphoglucose isomerase-like protein (cupin superfamily)
VSAPDLEALVKMLAPAVAVLLKQQAADEVVTLDQFLQEQKRQKGWWYALKRKGRAPRMIATDRMLRSAIRDWQAEREKYNASDAGQLAYQRRRMLAKKAAELSVKSPKHPHPRKKKKG